MKNIFQKIWLLFVSSIIIILLYVVFLLIKSWYNITIDNTWISIISDTTWAIDVTIETWYINTWITIEPPSDPRAYLDYIIEYGTWWIDYISKSPINQPNMSSKAWSENTARMHDYLYKNRIKFDIPTKDKQWYIMFVTSKPVSNISNIFLGVDGSTIWRLNKKASLSVENQDEFLYKLDEVSLIWNNDYHFSKDLSWKSNIYINAVVWESSNKVEKIIIFFR